MPHLDFVQDCPEDVAADTLGGRLSFARDLCGLGLGLLARRARVPLRALAAWESDRAAPETGELTRLARALDVSPMWLASGIGEGPPEDPADRIGFLFRRQGRDVPPERGL